MAKDVKNYAHRATPAKRSLTRVSSKHQITIPSEAFKEAGLATGDRLKVESAGASRVLLTRLTAALDELSGCLSTDGDLRRSIEAGRDEW